MTNAKDQQPTRFDESQVWLPPEFADVGLEAVRQSGSDGARSLDINVPVLSTYFAPTRPGTCCGLQGQTSHGKSLFMHYIEHRYALQLAAEERNQLIVHVSVEEPIEDMAMLALARHSGEPLGNLIRGKVESWPTLESTAITICGIPIVYIGDSADPDRRRPGASLQDSGMTLSNVLAAIERLQEDQHKTVAAITFDYLQAFPIDAGRGEEYFDQRRLQVRSDMYSIRRAAKYFGCTAWAVIQSKQELRGVRYDKAVPMPQIPGIYDGEETAAIAQRLDRYLAVWMPAKSYPLGTSIQVGPGLNDVIIVEEDQLFIKVLKQRGGLPSGRTYRFKVDFDTGDLDQQDLYG